MGSPPISADYKITADQLLAQVEAKQGDSLVPADGLEGEADSGLITELREVVRYSRAANTWRTYRAALIDYMRWAGTTEPFPISPAKVVAYLLANQLHHAPSTLSNRLSALGRFSVMLGYPDPTADGLVRTVLAGIRRKRSQPASESGAQKPWRRQQAPALTLAELVAMVAQVDTTSLRGLRDRAIIEVGFWGSCRVSELRAIRPVQLHQLEDHIEIELGVTKTDQVAEERHTKVLPRLDRDQLGSNPVEALESWLEASECQPEDYLFRQITKGGNLSATNRPLSDTAINQMLREYAEQAGVSEADRVSFHSLRAGFVTLAREYDLSDQKIMKQTQHKNARTLEVYDRPGRHARTHPINELIRALQKTST